MKFSIKDFFSKSDQIRSFLRIWSHLLKKSLMENFIFYAVSWTTLPKHLNRQKEEVVIFVDRVSYATKIFRWRHQNTKKNVYCLTEFLTISNIAFNFSVKLYSTLRVLSKTKSRPFCRHRRAWMSFEKKKSFCKKCFIFMQKKLHSAIFLKYALFMLETFHILHSIPKYSISV